MISLRLLALFAGLVSLTAFAGDPTGTWKFKAEGPNGRSVDSTLTLQWDGNRLSGSIDNRAGKVAISAATFADDQVTFQVDRKIRRRKLTVTYAGKMEGNRITGTIQTTGREEKLVSVPWNAHRVE
jgi:autotransporter translocation and assembly factor TamB